MKWIGQHIWDFISRFRSDVYLEDLSSDTSTNVLVIDSNKKIRTNSTIGGDNLSFDGSTANGVCTYKDADEISVEPNLTFNGSTCRLTGDLIVDGDSIEFSSANPDDPIFTLINTSNDTEDAAQMIFKKDRGIAPAVGTNLGEVRFIGEDSNQNAQEYGGMLCEIDVATDGEESGQFGIWVATHDGSSSYGLQLTGGDAEDKVNVAIGQGVASTTTIAGTLTMGSTAAMTNAGLLSVANQSNITGLGTISSGTWEGTDVGVAHGGTGLSTVGANEILTGNDTGALTSESTLTYDSETLTIGADDSGFATIARRTHSDSSGGHLTIKGGSGTGIDKGGGHLALYAGGGTGTGTSGMIRFYGHQAGSSGSSANTLEEMAHIDSGGNLHIDGSLKTGGRIELGDASDTTIGRSAAGVVTIEDKEIQTLAKHVHLINFGVNLAYNYARWVPWGSYYIYEQTTDNNPEYTTYVAPYDGKFIKLLLRSEEALGDTTIAMYKVGDGTEEPDAGSLVDTKTVDIASANTAYTYTFDSDATFSKGDAMSCKIQPTTDPSAAGVVGTFCLEFDLTT